MWRPLAVLALALLAVALVACGGGSAPTGGEGPARQGSTDPEGGGEGDAQAPGAEDPEAFADADPGDVEVIRAWTDALRGGDLEEAASYFSIPSIVQNGPAVIRIGSRDDARAFNRSLPCGALLVSAESIGDFTTATFELTERPGAGDCGGGVGRSAATAFVIRDGQIAEWRRVGTGDQAPRGNVI